jgi:spore coat protein A
MKVSRKEFLRLGLVGGAMLAVPFGTSKCSSRSVDLTGHLLRSKVRLPEPFQVPLPIPPVMKSVRSTGSVDRYEMTQRVRKAEILPGFKTQVWGYEGIFPGPTIETRSGRQVEVRQWNELPVPVSTHLHGGVTPPDSDGYPTDVILPAEYEGHAHVGHHSHLFKDYIYPSEQRAAALWYHDHRMDFTGPQVWQGLAGFHIIRDDEEDALPLPKGEKDVPLMISDRSFAEDGSFLYPSLDRSLMGEPGVEEDYMEGVLGDTILVNGAPWPFMEVSNTKYRFRILNASNARRYELALDPEPSEGASFIQVGSDGGLLGAPTGHRTIPIAQAERFDVIIDFSRYPAGTRVTMTNRFGEGKIANVIQFHVVRRATEDSTVPSRLVEVERLDRSNATITRQFDFDRRPYGWTINGKPFDPQRIDVQPRLGATEIWRLNTDAHHPVHLHLAHFQILSRNGGSPGPHDAGWKDTVDVRSGEETEIIVKFTGYRGRYVFHCHNLEHEDMKMMANFEVV